MKFTADDDPGLLTVSAYDDDGIVVKGERYLDGLILSRETLIADWGIHRLSELEPASMQKILALKAELVLLGTGSLQQFPDGWVYEMAAQAQVSLEVMNTAAACRTYNVLAMEGRKVVAALLPMAAK